eukprot:maker-scaffold_2-snap-gene-16.38-mRNA-1 protein AED:0.31 eAED:0.31 QI:53/1/1/1/1/1/2/49/116
MGQPSRPKKGAKSKKKWFKRNFLATKHRRKDVDQIQDDIKKGILTRKIPYDEDLPGGGQFYCAETDRHFTDQPSLDAHKKTKKYKRRLKHLKEEQYNQEEANLAAGISKEVYSKRN